MGKKIFLAMTIMVLLFIATACTVSTIDEIKTPEMVGKQVTVQGEVGLSIRIGSVSGYTVKDGTGSIAVSSENLPESGETVTVTGTLMRDTFLGYYIVD